MPTFKCPQCGGEFAADVEGQYTCPHCNHSIDIHLHVHGSIPWETWKKQGRLRAFVETWKKIMLNPVAFFKRVPPEGNFVVPLYYGILCQSVAIILMWSYQVGFGKVPDILKYIAVFGGYGPLTVSYNFTSVMIFSIVILVLAPIFATAGLFFQTLIYHVCLKIFGGANKTMEATFRSVCYSSSAQLLGIIPIVGVLVANIWALILNMIAMKEIHKTTYAKTIPATLLPVILCCGTIIFIIAILFGAMIGAMMGGGAEFL